MQERSYLSRSQSNMSTAETGHAYKMVTFSEALALLLARANAEAVRANQSHGCY